MGAELIQGNGAMSDELPGQPAVVLQGGEGGRGGRGGRGGAGRDGALGEAGGPGEPGEPGGATRVRYEFGPINVAAIIALVLAIASYFYYVVGLEKNNALLRTEFEQLRSNINSLNTPLSQRVFSVEARTDELGRIQQEIRARVEAIDANGTTQNKILKRDVDALRADVVAHITWSQQILRRIDTMQTETLENKLRIQYVIEALVPHETPRRGNRR